MPDGTFAGRGLEPKPPYDTQIEDALAAGRLAMPLWGVSLDPAQAWGYGTGGRHPFPRFMFEIVGAFPAIPAWRHSGVKEQERELICGGDYDVDRQTDERGITTARFSCRGPIG